MNKLLDRIGINAKMAFEKKISNRNKSKVLNDLIVAADTKVVANYDADCILPIPSYQKAYSAINCPSPE